MIGFLRPVASTAATKSESSHALIAVRSIALMSPSTARRELVNDLSAWRSGRGMDAGWLRVRWRICRGQALHGAGGKDGGDRWARAVREGEHALNAAHVCAASAGRRGTERGGLGVGGAREHCDHEHRLEPGTGEKDRGVQGDEAPHRGDGRGLTGGVLACSVERVVAGSFLDLNHANVSCHEKHRNELPPKSYRLTCGWHRAYRHRTSTTLLEKSGGTRRLIYPRSRNETRSCCGCASRERHQC